MTDINEFRSFSKPLPVEIIRPVKDPSERIATFVVAVAMIFARALVIWWLHRYIPGVPELAYMQCVALVVGISFLIGAKMDHLAWTREREPR